MAKRLYEELGLVNTKDMFKKAMVGKYAIPAYNFNNMEQLQAIVIGCAESKSPVILQVSKGAREYANQTLLRYMAMGSVKMVREMGSNIPIVLHLDHGDSFELCKSCIESGFSSVMIDGSHHPYEKNVELTKQVVEYAHKFDVTVEGELGVLAGIEDEVVAEHTTYTQPEEVVVAFCLQYQDEGARKRYLDPEAQPNSVNCLGGTTTVEVLAFLTPPTLTGNWASVQVRVLVGGQPQEVTWWLQYAEKPTGPDAKKEWHWRITNCL